MVASDAINSKNYKEWLNAIDFELKDARAINKDVAVVLRCVLNIPQKVRSTTRWAFKVKPGCNFKARQVVLGWKQKHRVDCETTLFVSRFDLPVIASAKRVNISDVQAVLLSWYLDKNELKSTIDFSTLYRVKELSCS